MRHLLFVGLSFAVLLAPLVGLAEPPPRDESERGAREIEALIRQLGDPSFAARQAATVQLLERPDAAPFLRQALKSEVPEVVRRVEFILEGHVRRSEKRVLAQLEDLARKGQVDSAIELLVRRSKWPDEDDAFQVMTGLAQQFIDLGEKEFGKQPVPPRKTNAWGVDTLPAGDFRRYREMVEAVVQPAGRVVELGNRQGQAVVRAEEIVAGHCRGDLLVSAGSVHEGTDNFTLSCQFSRCVVFAGGPVRADDLYESVIVCDGDLTIAEAIKSLIVVRGNLRIKQPLGGCRVFVWGDVECPRGAILSHIVASGNVYLSQRAANNIDTEVKENEPNPLSFVKWFDPASVGVVVEAAEGGVKVTQADEGKPFAKAGLRVGDLAVTADGKKIESPDAFRRLLRAKVVMGEELTLEVRRDGKPIKLTVDLSSPEPLMK